MTRLVSGASTAMFRIGFGLVGLILTVRFFAHGWIDPLFIAPEFHFKYPGFAWVEPLPGIGMYLVFGALALCSVSIALGLWHRVGAAGFAVGLAYVELIERTNFLNHYYWMILTAVVMAFLPMSRTWSLDVWRGRADDTGGRVPMWVVWLLRFQVGMVYFFAGVAKINPDWLVRAEPLSTWLPARAELWLVGPLLALPATPFALAWAGALFDVTVVGWLLIQRTRLVAYAALVAFHLSTWLLFPSIGVFPLVMGLGALVFFEPDWPRALSRRVVLAQGGGGRLRPLWVGVATVYVLAMLLIPVRHLAIPGDVRWTGEGYQGAWQVMLTDKTGTVDFLVTKDGSTWIVPPPAYLTDRQMAVMATDPALIAQTARLIAAEHGGSVSARALVAVNGRRSVRFTDESVDIGQGPPATAQWVTAAP
ncbi:MAG: HTTM domain-containing protein [Acidimicrobiia bacterium]